jgi:hypothetical protein
LREQARYHALADAALLASDEMNLAHPSGRIQPGQAVNCKRGARSECRRRFRFGRGAGLCGRIAGAPLVAGRGSRRYSDGQKAPEKPDSFRKRVCSPKI